MALTLEWRHRLDRWRDELPRHFYHPLNIVTLEGFVTKEQLTPREALERTFTPMPAGTDWGAKWEYGWFKGDLTLPEAAAGQRIALAVDVGAESIIFINGEAAGARDRFHKEITLTTEGKPDTHYDILIEGYAGHGPRRAHAGPTPPDRETVPEPGPTQATVGETTFGIWEEDVYQLWLDVETLFQIRENTDLESLRVAEIDAGLQDFTTIVDFELPHAEMLETVRACRERLKPLMACVNGTTTPKMFAFGHAHIDVAWLWPLAETERKAGRTFATQLALMKAYPEYKFLQSQPHIYRMVEERYPKLYERIKAAVKAGQFIPEGGAWVEPDTNISGGEALIRQFIHGKRFFKDEFGVDCEFLWLPDVFGYSGALPQIMRGCGVKYFSTQKIFWAYHGGDPFPYNTFIWEGIDGSEVFVHLHNDYNARLDPQSVIGRWKERVQKDGFATRLYPFGYGDGGGGPTRNHLEFARRLQNLEGVPQVTITHPLDYFKDQEARGWPKARYVGELYFQAHRGVLTSQAKTKKGNRKSEFALREAEMWLVAARALKSMGHSDDKGKDLDAAWKTVLLNQFHDILPGSSIHRVYEEAEAAYAEVLEAAKEITKQATTQFVEDGQAVTAFNSLSWPRKALVPLPQDFNGMSVTDAEGCALPVQVVEDILWTETTLPSCGWTTMCAEATSDETTAGNPVSTTENVFTVTERLLENDVLRIAFNAKGEITSIIDKEALEFQGEYVTDEGPCNAFKMYKDVPSMFDAWDIDSMYELTPVVLDEPATIEVVATGPLVGILRVTRKLHNSTMTQEISLRRGSRRMDFKTHIDWQERHKLLKVAFPVDIHADEALHEIQFGHIKRPNHRSRPFDADRFEVANHKWTALAEANRGFAVLNDCKYGVNVLGKHINLTLLKAPLAPDMTADQGMQSFTYAFYVWNGSFAESGVIQEGYDLNTPLPVVDGKAKPQSLFSVDKPNIIIETVKPAEDGSGDVIVRLYEAKRMTTQATLTTSLPITEAWETDMLEENTLTSLEPTEAPSGGYKIQLTFSPFKVKTVRLRLK
jgi:alpha-mannosidase